MNRDDITQVIRNAGVDALFIHDPYNMRYLSGFRGGEGMLYISEKQSVLITDSRYTEAAGKESSFTVIEENAGHRREAILQECLAADGAKSVGYEDRVLRVSEFAELQEKLPEVGAWLPLGGQIVELRRIKSREELDLLARAEAIGDLAFADMLGYLKAGMTELEAAAFLEYRMKMHGAQGLSFDTIMASGPNSSMPHAVPGGRVIREGDFVTMDFGCLFEGYCSDMTRTVVIGHADERQKEIYEVVRKAQTAGVEQIRAGMTGKEADAIARKVISEAGYGDRFGHSLGHSVGLQIHEAPNLSPRDLTILQSGMVVTIEPGIYIPDFGGVRIEDMVVVEEDGVRNLAHSPKELIEI